MRFVLSLLAATLVALAGATGTATAKTKKRCCFKVTTRMAGTSTSTWGQPPADQIGEDSVNWVWIERTILVYEERDGTPDLRLARLGDRAVRPSSGYFRETSSSVQVKHATGNGYYSVAEPGTCGKLEITARQASLPSLDPRSFADGGALATFPNAKYFLSASSSQATEDDGCTYRSLARSLSYLDFGPEQPCTGQFAFSLPAPSRAWFRHGKGGIQKDVLCQGGHQPAPPNINSTVSSFALGYASLAWFPPKKLKNKADRLKEIHQGLVKDGVVPPNRVASAAG